MWNFVNLSENLFLRFCNCEKFVLTCLTLYPALALVSINITFSSLAFRSPSSVETWRFSLKSVLLPTNIIMTSLPRSVRTSSIHLDVWWNELASVKHNSCVNPEMHRPGSQIRCLCTYECPRKPEELKKFDSVRFEIKFHSRITNSVANCCLYTHWLCRKQQQRR